MSPAPTPTMTYYRRDKVMACTRQPPCCTGRIGPGVCSWTACSTAGPAGRSLSLRDAHGCRMAGKDWRWSWDSPRMGRVRPAALPHSAQLSTYLIRINHGKPREEIFSLFLFLLSLSTGQEAIPRNKTARSLFWGEEIREAQYDGSPVGGGIWTYPEKPTAVVLAAG